MIRTDKHGKRPVFVVILTTLVFISASGLAVALTGKTLINLYWLIILSVAIASATIRPAYLWWNKAFQLPARWMGVVCHILFVAVLVMAAILSVNYFGRDKAAAIDKQVPITDVYRKKRYRQMRVGRYYYANRDPYYVDYIDVELPGGFIKSIPIDAKKVGKYHIGDSVSVIIMPGAFGFDVIEN